MRAGERPQPGYGEQGYGRPEGYPAPEGFPSSYAPQREEYPSGSYAEGRTYGGYERGQAVGGGDYAGGTQRA